jgi:hypothetical protein
LEEAIALYGATQDADAKLGIAAAFADTQFNYGARLLLQAMTDVGMPCWRYLFTRRRRAAQPGRITATRWATRSASSRKAGPANRSRSMTSIDVCRT